MMKLRMTFAVIGYLAFCMTANAAVKPVDNPEKFSTDIMKALSAGHLEEVASKVGESVGYEAGAVRQSLQVLVGKHFDYSDKVIDNKFGSGLRQIIFYTYIRDIGFVYFRFNFKMGDHGWLLANFIFKTETGELFPKNFVYGQ